MSNQTTTGKKIARAASAAANITKGAVTGGIYGAAVETAKSFLPELLRLFVVLVCLVILIPMIIFTALPNIVFGYTSSTDQEIIDFTASARELDSIYQTIEKYEQPLLTRLVDSILLTFRSDAGAQYDDYSVSQELGNMNKFWLMAIGSVQYKQDLYTMDEQAIESLLYDRLTYSTSLLDRFLSIQVRDLTPEEYMDKLGFTQEEKDWAALLYSTMVEDQFLSYGDTDGDGYFNTDYGDIIFTNSETPVVYYNQTDSRWGCEGNGSYHSLIPEGGKHYGLTVTGIGNDAKALVDALKDGKLVIAIMSKGHFTSSGHFIVLRGVTEDGNILVADPASVKRSNQEWALGIITNEASRRAGSGGPFWVMSA